MTEFGDARNAFHAKLKQDVYKITENGIATNTDKDSRSSVMIGARLAEIIGVEVGARLPAQTLGAQFEKHTRSFLDETFPRLSHLRPGKWNIHCVTKRSGLNIGDYEQYAHIRDVEEAAKENPALRVLLGADYTIASDVVLTRAPETDEAINANGNLIDGEVAERSSIRASNGSRPSLHACVSCKWTMRSDRAQNSRSEALRLIRSRKGRSPHIAVVTAEPLPSRLASIALGTGDIDCVYHIALPELQTAVKAIHESEAEAMLSLMIDGRRLKDIADLPLDLAI